MRKPTLFLAGLLLYAPTASAQEEKTPFALPSDLAGKRLEALLKPGAPGDARSRVTPLPRKAAAFLADPQAGIGPVKSLPPRLALPPSTTKQPPHPAEPTTLLHAAKTHSLPASIHLVTGEPVRWPSLSVHEVPALPILARPAADRVSSGDPTMEASLAAALQAIFLPRTSPVPFAAVNLPDPFEHRQTVELRDPPAENPTPLLVRFPKLR